MKKTVRMQIKRVFRKEFSHNISTMQRVLRSKQMGFLIFICSFFLAYDSLTPVEAVVEERDLAVSFASTDIPPYSLQASLIHAIESATRSIDIAIYALLDRKIIESLKRAAEERNVAVTVVVDPSATQNAEALLGRSIRLYERPVRGLMHTKIIVLDKKIVWYGTMNLTKTSLATHGNIGCGIYSPKIAALCIQFISNLIEKTVTSGTPLILRVQSEENREAPHLFFAIHPSASKETLKELLKRIEGAKKRIFIAMYTFTHEGIAEALIQAKRRGVDVRVLFDRDSARETSNKVYRLFENTKTPMGTRKKAGLLHYKCALIDSSFVMGSANWTKAAFSINAETFSIFDNLNPSLLIFLNEWWNRIELDSTISITK